MNRMRAFTLIEMAMVLLILGLLLAGFATPLKLQLALRGIERCDRLLQSVEDALLGYAVIERRLPCPDLDGDGVEESSCADRAVGGLPWQTLGLTGEGRDPWGSQIGYAISGGVASELTIGSSGTLRVCEERSCSRRLASDIPVIIYSTGPSATLELGEEEEENGDGDTLYISRPPAQNFDDRLRWLAANRIVNRLVAAGVVP